MSEPDNLVEQAQVVTDAAFQQIYDRSPQLLEFVKLRISFWDKLVVVDAGTLALSLTSVAYFHDHQVGDGGIGFLLAAWRYLLVSIVLSMLAQWFAVGAATYFFRQTSALALHLKLTRVSQALLKQGLQLGELHRGLLTEADTEACLLRPTPRPAY